MLDNDGLSDEIAIPDRDRRRRFEVAVGFSDAPPPRAAPVNCTVPKTVAIARTAIGMLAGRGEAPNEGRHRATSVIARVTVPRRSVLEFRAGGVGDPAERPVEAVHADLRDDHLSERRARRDYPDAFRATA